MTSDQHGHKRFVGGVIYCPRSQSRIKLGLAHRIYDAFVCPGCNVRIPERT